MSVIKHVTLQKIVAHYFRYNTRIYCKNDTRTLQCQVKEIRIKKKAEPQKKDSLEFLFASER